VSDPTARLPHALGGPVCHGTIKLTPEDFVVEEILGFEPSGEGEHVFLRIEKRGENTDYVARQLARFAGVSSRNVSYAGLKDRHGRTLQWFSIQLPGQSGPDWSGLDSDTIKVLDVIRNARKLRKGATSGNRFELTVRDLTATNEALEKRLADIARYGTPNYFGPQRFGHDGQNIEQARALFAEPGRRIDPHKRGLYLLCGPLGNLQSHPRQTGQRRQMGPGNSGRCIHVFRFQKLLQARRAGMPRSCNGSGTMPSTPAACFGGVTPRPPRMKPCR